MSFEVEIKFRAVDHEALAERLKALGAAEGPPVEQADAYLAHPTRDFAQTKEAFRLRSEGSRNCLTYKGPKRPGPTKTRTEIEVGFAEGSDAYEAMRTLLEALGFGPVALIHKRRRSFALEHEGVAIEVTLDLAEGIGPFAEVEALVEVEADLPRAQAAVLGLAGRLGLGEVEPRSYLRMALDRSNALGRDPSRA